MKRLLIYSQDGMGLGHLRRTRNIAREVLAMQPECQVLAMRLRSDLLPALLAARDGQLKHFDLRWRDEAALTVVMAAKGYPGAYRKGTEIGGIEAADAIPGVKVFHAGTAAEDGKLMAVGGRVLGVTALAPTIGQAQAKAYQAVDLIDWAAATSASGRWGTRNF